MCQGPEAEKTSVARTEQVREKVAQDMPGKAGEGLCILSTVGTTLVIHQWGDVVRETPKAHPQLKRVNWSRAGEAAGRWAALEGIGVLRSGWVLPAASGSRSPGASPVRLPDASHSLSPLSHP